MSARGSVLLSAHEIWRARWLERRDDLHRLGALVDGAKLVNEMLADLDSFLTREANELITLGEAAQVTGYSRDHLERLVRSGAIPNAGRPGAPRVRRIDLPRRPARSLATGIDVAYDPVADARALRGRRKGGANGDPNSAA